MVSPRPVVRPQGSAGRGRLALFTAAVLLAAGCRSENSASLRARLVDVVDGDTFVVRLAGGERETVRAIGVDAPEADLNAKLERQTADRPEDRASIVAMGREAARYAAELLPNGAELELVLDSANAATGHRDRYGRLLAVLYVLDGEERILPSINERMVRDGFAAALTSFPFDESFKRQMRSAEREARRESRGLWNRSPTPFDR